MGWLWACLGGGHEFQPKFCPDKSSKSSKSYRARITNQPHNLRLHPLPAQLSRDGHGDYEHHHLQSASRTGRCGDPENMEQFKIPTTSVNTCISINTLKRASERSIESSFRKEFGIARCSDVDELKEELAELRRRLAIEEAEAKKLREEVSHLRSCGVLQKSEGAPNIRIDHYLYGRGNRDAPYCAEEEKPRESHLAPIKQLRKCFSGPMLFDVQSDSCKESDETGAMVLHSSQARISSHRVGLSPKPLPFSEGSQYDQSEVALKISRPEEDGLVAAGSISKSSKVSLASNLQQYPSRKVTSWTSLDTPGDQDHCEGKARDLVILDSMDMHWIEVANAPCSSGFSTNVKGDVSDPRDYAESPRRSLRAASIGTDISIRNTQKPGGKRRQKSRSGLDFQPFERRSKDLTLALSNQPPALTSDQVEVQLAQALEAFKEQKRELEAKHQSFSRGPALSLSTSTPNGALPSNAGPVVGFFRSTRRKSHVLRNRGFHQRSLSPVEEAQSIEEIAWSRQSSASKKESETASKPSDSSVTKVIGSSRFCNSVEKSDRGLQLRFSAEDVPAVEFSSVAAQNPEQSITVEKRSVAIAEHIAMVPIQCASPSLSPRKRPASAALDALVTAGTAKPRAEGRYNVEDSSDGLPPDGDWIHRACDWDDEDDDGVEHIKPVECASPSFSSRRKSSRGDVSQSINLDSKGSSPRVLSSTEFLEESFLKANSPSITFKSPSQERSVKTPSPLKQYTPSPLRQCSPSPLNQCSPSPLKQCSSTTANECTPSPEKDNNERSWYCDAIEAIQSINDIRSFKERRLLTESVSLGSSPVSKEKTQRQVGCPRPPHAFSAEKKALRRAFSWFASEHDERVKTVGMLERPLQMGSEGTEKGNDNGSINLKMPRLLQNRDSFQRVEACGRRQVDASIKRVLHTRRFSDSDSGGSGSATFSIDLTQGDSSSQNEGECGAGDARGSINTGASFLRERIDKENVAARASHVPGKNCILRTSDQSLSSSDSTNKHPRCFQENVAVSESRPILGSMPFNHLDKTPIGPRAEESRVEWRAVAKPSYRYY